MYPLIPLPPAFGYLFFFFFPSHSFILACGVLSCSMRVPGLIPGLHATLRMAPSVVHQFQGLVSHGYRGCCASSRSLVFFLLPFGYVCTVSRSRSTCIGVPLPPVIRPLQSTNRHRQPFPGGVLGISVLTNRKGWWNEKSRSLLLPLGRRAVRQLRMNPLISPSDGAADWRP